MIDNDEPLNSDFCKKIMKAIYDAIYASLSVLDWITKPNFLDEGTQEVIFSGLWRGTVKGRRKECKIEEYWENYIDGEESMIGIHNFVRSNGTRLTEGQIMHDFIEAFDGLHKPKNKTRKLLRENPNEKIESFNRYLQNLKTDPRENFPIHLPNEKYALILLNHSLTDALRALHKECKTIDHGYPFISDQNIKRYSILYQETRERRTIDEAYLLRLLQSIRDEVKKCISGRLRINEQFGDVSQKEVNWYNKVDGGEEE